MEDLYARGLHGMSRGRPTSLFRGDISRMNWQGNLLDGLTTIVYAGGGGFDFFRTRQQAGLFASQRVPLIAQYKQKFTDEAAAQAFGALSSQGFVELEEGILKLLGP
jgi:hypothetical protein